MTLQEAIDLAHEIRETYPSLNVWCDLGCNSYIPSKYNFVWVSRETKPTWHECQYVTTVGSIGDVKAQIKWANIFHGL